MEISVTRETLLSLLKEIKQQVISIDLCTRSGKWLGQYFKIREVQDFKDHAGHMTVLLLHAETDDRCVVIDVRSTAILKLNKYLNFNGALIRMVRVHDANETIDARREETSLH